MCVSFLCEQNYFGDAWNVFDFIIVLGSIIDIIYTEFHVSIFQAFNQYWDRVAFLLKYQYRFVVFTCGSIDQEESKKGRLLSGRVN